MITLEPSVTASDPIERLDSKPSAPKVNGAATSRTSPARKRSAEAAWNLPGAPPSGCHNTGIHHVGLRASNPAASAKFYQAVLGMEIVGESSPDHRFGATAFLSSRPNEESHEIALFANPAFAHVAFKVSSLSELRSLYARVVERNIPIKFAADHGVSFAFYFDDPDGNMIEVYWPTGVHTVRQHDMEPLRPEMEPLDLSQPEDVLLEKVAPRQARALAAANENPTADQRNQPKFVPAGSGPAYWGPGDQITFLLTGEDTGGAFFIAEVSVPPGGGPPPHIHRREDETFYVQQGTLTVQVGGETLQASPGDCVYLPRGNTHCFKNTGNVDAKFLVVVTPAGLENFFAEAFRPAENRFATPPIMTEENLGRLLTAAARHGLEFAPPA
jgi:mannose-6-phosphate isomerase-like protein (cupin superfamily)/catechol 2,3-dioxygenase-like lactoylglutathione lyase family enzyme